MNLKNTGLSILRHVLTAAGGAVIANNPHIDGNLIQLAIGGLMAVFGLVWGAKDEYKAENP